MVQICEVHVFASHLETRLNVLPQFSAGVQEDSSKGKENICNTWLQVQVWLSCYRQKSIQANFGVFIHHHLHKSSIHQNLKLIILCKLSLFGSLWFLHLLPWSSYICISHIKPYQYEITMLENNFLSDTSILGFSDSCRTVKLTV